ncbi:class I SAM-dependent methyltransferase [Chitinophaga flava]|uniref:Class I SAM-dependent methyltransferase n=1 Tax=Chitinophaga flava TaxID=2259036 RepID=A0A365Y5N1_9BACT|nr:class I SAM-dependent methyltransferase [Chitinophaga flava]RBL93819.1 class I SAM-dependent methyltransferase [Chitinophaga flava]
MNCRICCTDSQEYLKHQILGKYEITYYKCPVCQFIQTESPFWLNEAYESAITSLDLGLLSRNNYTVPITNSILHRFFDIRKKFVDYGGGYGVFVRLMRDKGLDFYRQDMYCENVFAKHFDLQDAPQDQRFELLTAFEVFEHLVDPVAELEKMLKLSDNILFSTELQPRPDVNVENWWYFVPETGQHVSLYSQHSLEMLAQKFSLNYYTNNINIHLFTKKKINEKMFSLLTKYKVSKAYNLVFSRQPSLLPVDFSNVRARLNSK